MFGLTRSPFADLFTFQREIDRLFNQFWSDLPARYSAPAWSSGFRVTSNDEAWTIEVPMPGIDPQHVTLEVAGNTLSVRAEVPAEMEGASPTRYEQTLQVPAFLDLDRLNAAHRHGLLRLTLPLKESVRPRRVQIETTAGDQKQLTAA
jgi:HSP20 family protein